MTRVLKFAATAVLSLAVSTFAQPAQAQECEGEYGGEYTVRGGDFLIKIARRVYDDGNKWSLIYGVNTEVIGDDPDLIQIGDIFRIPCIGKVDSVGSAGGSTEVDDEDDIRLLTADDYRPFTDRDLPRDGLITQIVDEAFAATGEGEDYGIAWINDWSAHLDPLLLEAQYDMGFPWLQPDCAATPDSLRCAEFLFSEPMFEMLVLLFTDQSRPIAFTRDSDIHGRTLCRPAGYYTHDLDKDGRNWLRDGRVELLQPGSVAECFELLLAGDVDAVAVNEFTGRTALKDIGITDEIKIVDARPLSIEGLHVIVARSHPRAEELIERVNTGLEELQDTGEYNRIVDQHLGRFWAELES